MKYKSIQARTHSTTLHYEYFSIEVTGVYNPWEEDVNAGDTFEVEDIKLVKGDLSSLIREGLSIESIEEKALGQLKND